MAAYTESIVFVHTLSAVAHLARGFAQYYQMEQKKPLG